VSSSYKQRIVIVSAGVLGMIALCIYAFPYDELPLPLRGAEWMRCHARNTQTPEAPIYPNSVLVDVRVSDHLAQISGYVEYTYETPDAPEDVMEFYEETGANCLDEIDRNECDGEATPFGVYDIYLTGDQEGVTQIQLVEMWT
jgi:hypothetical protein